MQPCYLPYSHITSDPLKLTLTSQSHPPMHWMVAMDPAMNIQMKIRYPAMVGGRSPEDPGYHSALANPVSHLQHTSRSAIYLDSTSVPCIIHHTLETFCHTTPQSCISIQLSENPRSAPDGISVHCYYALLLPSSAFLLFLEGILGQVHHTHHLSSTPHSP